jgi:gamma-D-glutamyl-L-lysine dipeptidyl-peptidase
MMSATEEILDYGVCRLAIVAIRQAPSDTAPQVSQLLFGDHYVVLQKPEGADFVFIRTHFDSTEGWIESEQHHTITQEYFDQINLANFKITTDLTCNILYKKSPLTLVMGSIVPISNSELFKIEEQFAFNGEGKSLGQKRDGEFIKSVAMKYLNAPHLPGGKSPFGIDAPGLVQMAYKIAGYALPHSLESLRLAGRRVKSLSDAQPGDLAFFSKRGKEKEVTHVGLLLGDQRIIHADGRVRIDHLMEEGIERTDSKIFTHSLREVRRVVTNQ